MKKRVSGKKLNRTTNARKQLFRQLTKSLVIHGYLVTTEAKAAAVKPFVERLVNQAKDKRIVNFRQLVGATGDFSIAKKLTDIGQLFASRSGGYTQILKIGRRAGDDAELVRLEWVEKLTVAEPVTGPKTTHLQDKKNTLPTGKMERKIEKPKEKTTIQKKETKK